MLAGHERNRLVGALAWLRAELGLAWVPEARRRSEAPFIGTALAAEDEELLAAVVEELARLGAAAAATDPPLAPLPESVRAGAIAGAEWVMRSTLLAAGPAAIATLVPDFVYLVTLPYLDEEGAQAAAARSRELIEADEPTGSR